MESPSVAPQPLLHGALEQVARLAHPVNGAAILALPSGGGMHNGLASARAGESARNLALINYALLCTSVVFAGLTALVAVIIAYSQRDEAPPAIRAHHQFQIRIFWVGFGLSLAAGLFSLAATINAMGDLFQITREQGWDSLSALRISLSQVTIDGTLLALAGGAVLMSLLTALWLVGASMFGFIRLASKQGMGHTPGA